MNLGTMSLVVTTIGSILGILAFFWKAIRHNKSRARAQQCRIDSVMDICEIHNERLKNIENYLSLPEKAKGKLLVNEGFINLEVKAMNEYQEHHTNLT
jgi:hypothetical protein